MDDPPRTAETEEPPRAYDLAPADDPAPMAGNPRRGPRLARRLSPRRSRADAHVFGLSPVYIGFLVGLAAVWMVLAVASLFFHITSAVGFLVLGFGPALFLMGYYWIMGVAAFEDGRWWWLFPIPLAHPRSVVNYARLNPERAGKPFALAMLGGVLFLLTFALFLLKQQFGLP